MIRYSKEAYVVSYVSNEGRYTHIRVMTIPTGVRVDSTNGKSEEFDSLLSLTKNMIKKKLIKTPVDVQKLGVK